MDVSLANPRRRVGTIVGKWFVTKADVGYRQERDPAQRLRPRRQPTLVLLACKGASSAAYRNYRAV